MIGAIVAWSGAIVDIPVGWQLCDGSNGTPDLRNRFIYGAGDGIAVNETGGDTDHSHEFQGDGHDHSFVGEGHKHDAKSLTSCAGTGPATVWAGDGVNNETEGNAAQGDTNSEEAEGTTYSTEALPPFYGLAFIQRLS